jgi:hypothetical protein
MIPDFVLQLQETERNLKSQSIATRGQWQDSVAARFYNRFIDEYDKKINAYLFGDVSMYGMGLDELLKFIDAKQNEMKELSGMDLPTQDYSMGRVHDFRRERDPWNTSTVFPYKQPGEMNARDRHEIMDERDHAVRK